jgi:hypothetical protein
MPGAPDDLIAAVVAGDAPRVQQLLEQGASPDSRNEQGLPALALAVVGKNAAIVKALLGQGADVHAKTSSTAAKLVDVPVVWFAAVYGSTETLRLILQAGDGPDTRDGDGITPLMAAATLGNTEAIQVLIAAKADLKARDLKGRTPLTWAADGGQYEAARLLLDAGAEVDALGELKAPPLIYAAQRGATDVVALLVERGADVNRKAAPGLTALDIARQNHHEMTVALLENGGRQKPAVAEFQRLRPILYPEYPLEAVFLDEVTKDPKREAAKRLAVKGEIQRARDLLEAASRESQGQPGDEWPLIYLQQKLGDRTAAVASLRKLLATPDLSSRGTLRAWKLLRDLGEAPPPDLARRVLGVVVESGLGPAVLAIATYADGQPRFFSSTGGGVFGERWTDGEQQKARETVRLAQELVEGMALTEDRELPRPGRVRFLFLTPGGSYGAEDSLGSQAQARYEKVFAASDQLFRMLLKRYEAAQTEGKP